MTERTPSGRKYNVRHLGPGQTNPSLLSLAIYLAWGFEQWPESEYERHQEDAAERAWSG